MGGVAPTSSRSPAACILVVDDEPGVRRFACQALEREGFTTVEAGDGAEALRILECGAPVIGLVLSDIRMPKVDGIQLERTCRERWPGIPVLLMSGEVTRDWVLRLVREGAPEVLRKPFQPATLVQTVRSILQPPNGGAHNLAGG